MVSVISFLYLRNFRLCINDWSLSRISNDWTILGQNEKSIAFEQL